MKKVEDKLTGVIDKLPCNVKGGTESSYKKCYWPMRILSFIFVIVGFLNVLKVLLYFIRGFDNGKIAAIIFNILYFVVYLGYLLANVLILIGLLKASKDKIKQGASLLIPLTIIGLVLLLLAGILAGAFEFVGWLIELIIQVLVAFLWTWWYFKMADMCERFG